MSSAEATALPDKPALLAIVDRKEASEALADTLARCRFSISRFETAEALLASGLIEEPRLTCVIAALQLPTMNAVELHAQLAARGLRLPTVFVADRFEDYGRFAPETRLGDSTSILYRPFDEAAVLSAILAASQKAV